MRKPVQQYLDLLDRQRSEINEFPVAYAFDEKQLEEALIKLNATQEEVVTIFGHGDIVKKENAKKFIVMLKCHTQEIKDLILSDEKIAEAAFKYEMDNHEYCINYSGDEDVLSCFGIDEEELTMMGLRDAYHRARRTHMKTAHEEWGII